MVCFRRNALALAFRLRLNICGSGGFQYAYPFPEYREIVARVVKALAVTAMRYHRRGRRGSASSRAFERTARRTWQSIFPTMRYEANHTEVWRVQ
jgi:hypothetical protein